MSQDSAVSATAEVRPEVRVIRAPELGNSSFLVADAEAGEAIVIDPFRDVEQYLVGAEELGVTIRQALDTHLHNDFASGCRELATETGAGIEPPAAGSELALGRFTVRALHTPGHTPTHLSYLLCQGNRPLALFSGGALMVGAIARTDLFGPHLAVHLALEAFRTLKVRLPRAAGRGGGLSDTRRRILLWREHQLGRRRPPSAGSGGPTPSSRPTS